MKVCISGDWHIRSKPPQSRMDKDYLQSIFDKTNQIYNAARKYNCRMIIQPGDMFDTSEVSDYVIRCLIIHMSKLEGLPIYTIPGQHDLRYHSKIWKNTPMGIIDAFNFPVSVISETITKERYEIYGSGYGEDIPIPSNNNKFKILVCHKMIINKKLWPGQDSYDYEVNSILKQFDYDLIVSGDNHTTFVHTHENKTLVNCGSLIRTRIDQIFHVPCFFIFDTETRELVKHALKVKPAEDVLNIAAANKELEDNKHLQAFVKKIKEQVHEGNKRLNFRKNMINKMKSMKKALGGGVINVLKEVMIENDEH